MMAAQSLGLAKDKLVVLPWAAEPDTELGDYFLSSSILAARSGVNSLHIVEALGQCCPMEV